jgi:hypothetical protein
MAPSIEEGRLEAEADLLAIESTVFHVHGLFSHWEWPWAPPSRLALTSGR